MVDAKYGLEAIWPEEAIRRFQSAWIETPFQLVSIANTPAGMTTIADLTELKQDEVERMVKQSISLLSEDEVAQTKAMIDPENMPLGALKPE